MRTETATAFRVWTAVADAVIVASTYVGVVYLRSWLGSAWPFDLVPSSKVYSRLSAPMHTQLTALVVVVWLSALVMAGTYNESPRKPKYYLMYRLVRATIMAVPLLVFLLFALQVDDWARTSRSVVAAFSIATVGTLYLGRSLLWRVRRSWLKERADHRLLVIGSPEEASPFLESLFRHAEWGIRVVGVVVPEGEAVTSVLGVRMLGTLKQLPGVLTEHAIDQVFMTGRAWDTATLRRVADTCEEVGVRFSMDANFLGLSISAAELNDFEGWSVLTFSSTPTPSGALLVKRWMDIFFSGLALVVLAPVFALVALIIKLEDGGPVFFAQERCGLYGRRFKMYKFRSMVIDAEARLKELQATNEMQGPVFKMKRDPRITRIGAFIRKFSVDEFPQFYNVFIGEMSLVGPRPPVPPEVERYARWQMRRLSMRPGLTCIWQVSGRSNITDFDQWMRLDLDYIDNWSLTLDMKLILLTVPVVILAKGAR